jgi:hypothetical protein
LQETRYYLSCFRKDDSDVLPDQLHPAPTIYFAPLRWAVVVLYSSIKHQPSAGDLFHQIHFAPCAFPPLLSTQPYLAFHQRRRGYLTFEDSTLCFGAYIDNLILVPPAIKDWHFHHNNITIRPPTAFAETCKGDYRIPPAVCTATNIVQVNNNLCATIRDRALYEDDISNTSSS